MVKEMATCKVCGRDFPLMAEKHYVAQDPMKIGVIANLMNTDRTCEYDAFDCPYCGCQNVIQGRKLVCLDDEDGEDEEEEDEEIRTQIEHDGCCGCKYQDRTEDEDPCIRCKHRYMDRWEAEDDE